MRHLHYVLLLTLGLVGCGQSEPDAPAATEPPPAAPALAETPAPQAPPPAATPAPEQPAPAQLAAEPAAPPPPAAEELSDEAQEKLARAQKFLAKVEAGLKLAQALKAAVEDEIEERGAIPPSFADVRTRTVPPESSEVESIELQDSGSIVVEYAPEPGFEGGTIVLTPRLSAGDVTWECRGGSLPAELRPDSCE